MRIARPLRRFFELNGEERRLLARAAAWLIAVDFMLRVWGFRRVVAQAQAAGSDGHADLTFEDLERSRRYAHWIESASRYHFIKAQCLHCSLVLHAWLRREGLASELRIGVQKAGGELK